MTKDDLDLTLTGIAGRLVAFNKWPCLSAYDDVLNIQNLSEVTESTMSGKSLAELAASSPEEHRAHFRAAGSGGAQRAGPLVGRGSGRV